jgi:hypothetical protein
MVVMDAARAALFRKHQACCNGHDVGSLVGHYPATSRILRDGELVGEGADSVLKALEAEFPPGGMGRVVLVEGEPVLLQWSDAERLQRPNALVRLKHQGDRVSEVRIDHDPGMLQEFLSRASF